MVLLERREVWSVVKSLALTPSAWFAGGVEDADLAKRLMEMGLPETDSSIAMKINRGAFPAWFLYAVMHAIGAHTLRLD